MRHPEDVGVEGVPRREIESRSGRTESCSRDSDGVPVAVGRGVVVSGSEGVGLVEIRDRRREYPVVPRKD